MPIKDQKKLMRKPKNTIPKDTVRYWKNKAQSLALKNLRCLDCEEKFSTNFGEEQARIIFKKRELLCYSCEKKRRNS